MAVRANVERNRTEPRAWIAVGVGFVLLALAVGFFLTSKRSVLPF